MNKINFLPIIHLSLLVGCGETEVSQKYVFDPDDMEKNIKNIQSLRNQWQNLVVQ